MTLVACKEKASLPGSFWGMEQFLGVSILPPSPQRLLIDLVPSPVVGLGSSFAVSVTSVVARAESLNIRDTGSLPWFCTEQTQTQDHWWQADPASVWGSCFFHCFCLNFNFR